MVILYLIMLDFANTEINVTTFVNLNRILLLKPSKSFLEQKD